jgi:hypothetical protein
MSISECFGWADSLARVNAEGQRGGDAPSRGDVGPYAELRGPQLKNMVHFHLLVQLVCVKTSVGHV